MPQASLKMEPNLAALKSNIVYRQLGHWISTDDLSPEFPLLGWSLFLIHVLTSLCEHYTNQDINSLSSTPAFASSKQALTAVVRRQQELSLSAAIAAWCSQMQQQIRGPASSPNRSDNVFTSISVAMHHFTQPSCQNITNDTSILPLTTARASCSWALACRFILPAVAEGGATEAVGVNAPDPIVHGLQPGCSSHSLTQMGQAPTVCLTLWLILL